MQSPYTVFHDNEWAVVQFCFLSLWLLFGWITIICRHMPDTVQWKWRIWKRAVHMPRGLERARMQHHGRPVHWPNLFQPWRVCPRHLHLHPCLQRQQLWARYTQLKACWAKILILNLSYCYFKAGCFKNLTSRVSQLLFAPIQSFMGWISLTVSKIAFFKSNALLCLV